MVCKIIGKSKKVALPNVDGHISHNFPSALVDFFSSPGHAFMFGKCQVPLQKALSINEKFVSRARDDCESDNQLA